MGESREFCAAFNHWREQVWFNTATTLQDDNARSQTTIVLQLGERPKWTLYDPEVTFCGQFDDDLNGIRFGGIDQIGVFKEFESYEGDGIDDPDDTALCEGTIASASGSTITVTGSPAWTTNELRGMGVVLRDKSTGTIYYDTIKSNTSGGFTLVGQCPIATIEADTDEYEIGGIKAYLEFSEQQLGSANKKSLRFLYHEFDDLTAGRFV